MIIVILLFVLLVLLSIDLRKEKFIKTPGALDSHGYTRFNCLNEADVEYLKTLVQYEKYDYAKHFLINNKTVNSYIDQLLGPDYGFQDYIMFIKKSRIHTCHKDNNSKLINPKQKWPSYTIIFYLYPMEKCLDVIEGSHQYLNSVYVTDPTKSIECRVGDAILFDASLTHSGSLNLSPDHPRIQMKISHSDDIETLDFFENYRKVLKSDNKNSETTNKILKHVSCQLPVVSDSLYSKDAAPSSIFNTLVYGNNTFHV